MKLLYLFILLIAIFDLGNSTKLYAQAKERGNGDVIVNNDGINQSMPRLTVAFNGWIFAGYMAAADSGYKIFKSIDGGNTWLPFVDSTHFGNSYNDFDIIVTGADTTHLYLWVSYINNLDNTVYVVKYSAAKDILLSISWNDHPSGTLKHVAIASGYKNPGTLSTGYSLGIAYTVSYQADDSMICVMSVDSGATWNRLSWFGTTGNPFPPYLHKVSIAYGHSAVEDSGYYFVAFEQSQNFPDSKNNSIGLLYNTENNLQRPSNPLFIDSKINSFWAGALSSPSVIIQNSANNNSKSKLSEMVLFNYTSSGVSNAAGVSSALGPTLNSTNFVPQYINTDNCASPEGSYDPIPGDFIFSVADSTSQTLPYYVIGQNAVNNSITWIPYQSNLSGGTYPLDGNSNPRADIIPTNQRAAVLWRGLNNSDGITLFSVEDSTTTDVSVAPFLPLVKIYPNPASQYIDILLPNVNSILQISIYNTLGQIVRRFSSVKGDTLHFDIAGLPEGIYYMWVFDGVDEQVKKFTMVR